MDKNKQTANPENWLLLSVRINKSISFCVLYHSGAFSEVYMVKEKKTGKMFAMKCVKKKQKIDLNLENEINVLRK